MMPYSADFAVLMPTYDNMGRCPDLTDGWCTGGTLLSHQCHCRRARPRRHPGSIVATKVAIDLRGRTTSDCQQPLGEDVCSRIQDLLGAH